MTSQRSISILFSIAAILFLSIPSFSSAQHQQGKQNLRVLEDMPEIDCTDKSTDECAEAPQLQIDRDPKELETLNPNYEQTISVHVFGGSQPEVKYVLEEPKDMSSTTFFENIIMRQSGTSYSFVIPAKTGFLKQNQLYKIKYTARLKHNNKILVSHFVLVFGLKEPTVKVNFGADRPEGRGLEDEIEFHINITGAASSMRYALSYQNPQTGVSTTIESVDDFQKNQGDVLVDIRYRFPVPRSAQQVYRVTLSWYVAVDDDYLNEAYDITITRPNGVDDDYFVNKVREMKDRDISIPVLARDIVSLANSISNHFNPDKAHPNYLDPTTTCDDSYCGGRTEARYVFDQYCACKFPCKDYFEGATCNFENNRYQKLLDLYYDILDLLQNRAPLTDKIVGQHTEALKTIVASRHVFSETLLNSVLEKTIQCVGFIPANSRSKDTVEDVFYIVETLDVAYSTDYFSKWTEQSQPEVYADKITTARNSLFHLILFLASGLKDRDLKFSMFRTGLSIEKVLPERDSKTTVVPGFRVQQETRNNVGVLESDIVLLQYPWTLLNRINNGQDELSLVATLSDLSPYDLASGDDLVQITGFVTIGIYGKNEDGLFQVNGIFAEEPEDRVKIIFTKLKQIQGQDINLVEARCGVFDDNALNWIISDACETRIEGAIPSQVACLCKPSHARVAVLARNSHPSWPVMCFGANSQVPECLSAPTFDLAPFEERKYNINPAIDDVIHLIALVGGAETVDLQLSLAHRYHKPEEETDFFSKVTVTRPDMTILQILFPSNVTFEYKVYNLRALIFTETNGYRVVRVQEIAIEIPPPPVIVDMVVSPVEGKSVLESYSLQIEVKHGQKSEEIPPFYYVISYVSSSLLTLATGNYQAGSTMPKLTLPFPYARGTDKKAFEIRLDFFTLDGSFVGNSRAFLQALPEKIGLDHFTNEINKIDAADKNADLSSLLQTTLSYIKAVTPNDEFHTQTDFPDKAGSEGKSLQEQCDETLCLGRGSCQGWNEFTGCTCKPEYTGPSCNFKTDESKAVIQNLIKVLKILQKPDVVKDGNVDWATEIVKAISRNRHVYSVELAQEISLTLYVLLTKLPQDRLTDESLIEDIFLSVDSISFATTNWHIMNERSGVDLLQSWNLITELRQIAENLNILIVKVTPDKKATSHLSTYLYGQSVDIFQPSKLEQDELRVTVDLKVSGVDEQGNGKQEVQRATFAKPYLQSIRSDPEKVTAVVVQAFQSNPYILATGDYYTIISNTLNVKMYDQNEGRELKDMALGEEDSARFYWTEVRTENFAGLQCAYFENTTQRYVVDTTICRPIFAKTDNVECNCRLGIGSFVLVKKNRDPTRPHVADTEQIIPPPTNPTGDGEVTWATSGLASIRMTQLLFTIILIGALWGSLYSTSLQERLPTPSLREDLSYHPIFSVLRVYGGSITNSERCAMLFLTIITQLTLETFLNKGSKDITFNAFAFALLLSWPLNYLWGIIARFTSASQKEGGFSTFIIISQVLFIGAVIYNNMAWVKLSPPALAALIFSFLIGLVVDLAICDTIMTFAAGKVPQVAKILSYRGFHQTGAHATDVYVQHELKSLTEPGKGF